jgi:hypothetical protein
MQRDANEETTLILEKRDRKGQEKETKYKNWKPPKIWEYYLFRGRERKRNKSKLHFLKKRKFRTMTLNLQNLAEIKKPKQTKEISF